MKPGAGSFFHVTYMGAGSQGFEPFFAAYLGHKHGAVLEMEQVGLKQTHYVMSVPQAENLAAYYYATMGPPAIF